MPVIVDADTHRASTLAGNVGMGSHVVSTLQQLDSWLVRRPNEYAVMIGPDVELAAAVSTADRLRLSRPGMGVVLLRDVVTTEVMAQAMHAGIREVVQVSAPEMLAASVARCRETYDAIHGDAASAANNGRVLTVFSPKGGVGKTTIAVNLALALTDNGANRVCLVDLDLAFGDVAITMQLIPEHTVVEATEVGDDLDLGMLNNLLTRHDSGLAVLAAPTHPDAMEQITATLVRRLLRTLRNDFDYIVVDCAPGFDEQVLAAFDETDECIVVVTLDVPTVKNVKMSMETLDLLNLVNGHRWLVLNRADKDVGLAPANVEAVLDMKIVASFESSVDVANATNHGRPIVLAKPDHQLSRSMRTLCEKLSVAQTTPTTPTSANETRKRGLFARSSRK